MAGRKVELLPREALVKTNPLDQADWNYRGVLGAVQRRRFALVAQVLGARHYDRLLEVGYGSGVFMPELRTHCRSLHGIDPHDRGGEVTEVLAGRGIAAFLVQASMTAIPYEDGAFDAIVTVSSLEFVDDIETACRELARVLRPGGRLVAVTPGHARILDLGLRALSGERAEDTFQGRRQLVIPALTRHFRVDQRRRFPPLPGAWMYTVLGLTA